MRAKQDRGRSARSACCRSWSTATRRWPGQGVVVETLQMSQLRALPHRRHRPRRHQQPGRLHHPAVARAARSIYSTDVAKTIQAPIFHVNGDDPEAVVRVAELAFAYRQEFKRDVVIDLDLLPPPRAQRGRRPVDDPAADVQPHRGQAQRPHPLHRGARRSRRHHRRRSTRPRTRTSRTASSAPSPRPTPRRPARCPIVTATRRRRRPREARRRSRTTPRASPTTTGVDRVVVAAHRRRARQPARRASPCTRSCSSCSRSASR